MESRSRGSPEQFAALIEFMERNGDLARPQPGLQGRIRGDRLWQELANMLNSMGGGVNKPVEKWKKVWADWKTKTKKKMLNMQQHAAGNGGGPHSRQTLSALEERVIGILGLSAVVGQHGIPEQGFSGNSLPVASVAPVAEEPVFEIPDVQVSPIAWFGSPATPPPNREPSPPLVARSPPPPPAPRTPPPQPPAPRTASPTPRSRSPPPRLHSPPLVRLPRTPPRRTRRPPPAFPRSMASTPHRRQNRPPRRNRGETPFDRAASAFVDIERRRLQLEETRERHHHELEVERLRLEANRIEVGRELNQMLQHLAVIAERLIATLSARSLPSTDVIQDTE